VARITACILTVLGIVGGQTLRAGVPAPPEAVHVERLPLEFAGWQGRDVPVTPQVLDLLRPDGFLLRNYFRTGEPPIQVYIDYHRVQRLGATIHSPRICYPGAGWNPTHIEVAASDAGGSGHPGCWLRLRNGDRELLAMYWYESRWGSSARELELKLGIVRSAFARHPSDAALIRVSTPVLADGVEGARKRLLGFLEEAEPRIRRELPFETPRS